MSTLAQRRTDRGFRTALASVAAFVAIWAYAGAVGLASGAGADLGSETTARLPFHSPGIAAMLLALVVGIPMTVSAVAALRSWKGVVTLCGGSGLLLFAWVTIQPIVIGRSLWQQPVLGLLGSAMCVLAYGLWRHRHHATGRASRAAAVSPRMVLGT
ncbi:hypothetical protein OG225_18265 [Nocardia sp. NBC_01377]|uniref:hypothetical protein n=1 Tax=Nocardia sp. NBC_01377 TaxID=2903595 RepID=UPI00324D8089